MKLREWQIGYQREMSANSRVGSNRARTNLCFKK